jgi:hypothetical protein
MQHRSLSPAASPRGGASSLLRVGIGSTTQTSPAHWAPRSSVLKPQGYAQQLSLFGRPGGSR